jgi:hypothetical protein
MTPAQFSQWLADVKSAGIAKNDRQAAGILGLSHIRISQMRKTGTAQVQTDYACAAILAGLQPSRPVTYSHFADAQNRNRTGAN